MKGGSVPAKAHDDLEALKKDWQTCAGKTASAAKPEVRAIGTTDAQWHTKNERLEAPAEEKYAEKVAKECAPQLAKVEQALVQFSDGRSAERMAVFEKAKARFK